MIPVDKQQRAATVAAGILNIEGLDKLKVERKKVMLGNQSENRKTPVDQQHLQMVEPELDTLYRQKVSPNQRLNTQNFKKVLSSSNVARTDDIKNIIAMNIEMKTRDGNRLTKF